MPTRSWRTRNGLESTGCSSTLKHLSMLHAVVTNGVWPKARGELFEAACQLLLRETNEEHLRSQMRATPSASAWEAAGMLSAIVLCGGASGVAVSQAAASEAYPFVGDLSDSPVALQFAAHSRLFRWVAPERLTPAHRTVAEYLWRCPLRGRATVIPIESAGDMKAALGSHRRSLTRRCPDAAPPIQSAATPALARGRSRRSPTCSSGSPRTGSCRPASSRT